MIPDSLLRSAADLQADAADRAVEAGAAAVEEAVSPPGRAGEPVSGADRQAEVGREPDPRVDFGLSHEEVLTGAKTIVHEPSTIQHLDRVPRLRASAAEQRLGAEA